MSSISSGYPEAAKYNPFITTNSEGYVCISTKVDQNPIEYW